MPDDTHPLPFGFPDHGVEDFDARESVRFDEIVTGRLLLSNLLDYRHGRFSLQKVDTAVVCWRTGYIDSWAQQLTPIGAVPYLKKPWVAGHIEHRGNTIRERQEQHLFGLRHFRGGRSQLPMAMDMHIAEPGQ